MMLQHGLSITMLLLSAGLTATGQQGYGWLDRVVQFQKNKLFSEFNELAPINMKVDLQRKSEGYEDSRHWDYNSVLRLLSLIRVSETAKPVHNALRRMLQPTRRVMMSMKQSMKRFPSIKNEDNNFYYDVDYTSAEEDVAPPATAVPEDQAVIVVSNPVEARLPSARISVKLLREILEARARAARQMPTTTPMIPWIEFIKNRTSTGAGSTDTTASRGTETTKSPDGVDEDSERGDATEPQPEGETEAGGDTTTGADPQPADTTKETTTTENTSAESAIVSSTVAVET